MTGNSPEPDSGRLPDNIDENNSVHDEFNGDFNERSIWFCPNLTLEICLTS
jgi:hypothetical protein